jgi:2-oxoisovalerate dehydrogenase E1 component
MLQAVGVAKAMRLEKKDSVVYVSLGEGTTSQGDFHEALNWASREKLPLIVHLENNHFAISVRPEEQTTDGNFANLVKGYPNIKLFDVDGTDFFASADAFDVAVKRAREGNGSSLVLTDIVRIMPHSSSDDQLKYRAENEVQADLQKCPLKRFELKCLQNGWLSERQFGEIKSLVSAMVDQTADWALAQPDPDYETATQHVYAVEPDNLKNQTPLKTAEKVVLVDAINHALHEEMAANDRILVYGQDIADGKGGVFTATRGLSSAFGLKRAFNSPLAESSIVGTAIGLSLMGYKPVVEIQFGDYIWTAMMQLRNEMATICYRSNGDYSVSPVIRTAIGGYIGGGLCHSQNIEATFAHIPGIYIAYPSNAEDAKGMLKYAMRCHNPVLFLEHKGLYRQAFAARPEPDASYVLPFGKAKIVAEGQLVTIVTYGMMVERAREAVVQIGAPPHSVEIIDLRSIIPLDRQTILNSVKKTGKVLVLHEDAKNGGFGGEIAALIAEEAFEYLDAPILRIGAFDAPIPFHKNLEKEILPQVEGIAVRLRELLDY